VVGSRAKFQKERLIYETNCWLTFCIVLPAKSNEMKSNEKKHVTFAHELHSALRLAVEFSNVYCEL